jgi:uncharacterized membrane protein (DUF485 family)
MAGFDHGPAHPQEIEDPIEVARRLKISLWLFGVYCVFYAGFVLLNAFAPKVMEITFGGVNLAIWYGFALIGGALFMALLYAWLCREKPQSLP